MRKLITGALVALLLLGGCQKSSNSNEEDITESSQITQRSCASTEVLEAQLAADPSLRDRMNEIESFTRRMIGKRDFRVSATTPITIPVVVHVIYKTKAENISQAQVQSQIDVLNKDFNKQNNDVNNTPTEFKPFIGDVGVNFVLDRVIRKQTSKKSWPANDAMKKTASGGSDAIDPSNYLNIWVCNLSQGLLGYAQFPGGQSSTDGVVILYSAFGNTGTLIPDYNLGRTATHEIGHWMNLYHIWGDRTCGTDLVDDTPKHKTANYGCPNYPHLSECTGNTNEMTMNYMDYTDDACMYMFTAGQSDRMLAIFAQGGPRASFVN